MKNGVAEGVISDPHVTKYVTSVQNKLRQSFRIACWQCSEGIRRISKSFLKKETFKMDPVGFGLFIGGLVIFLLIVVGLKIVDTVLILINPSPSNVED